jgi:hypothetical protein
LGKFLIFFKGVNSTNFSEKTLQIFNVKNLKMKNGQNQGFFYSKISPNKRMG